MDVITILLLLGAIHGIFLASVIVFLKGKEKHSNKLLAMMLFLFSVILVWHVSFHGKEVTHLDNLIPSGLDLILQKHFIVYGLVLLIGPLLYLYFQSQIKESFSFRWTSMIHFSPAMIALIIVITVYFRPVAPWLGRVSQFMYWFIYFQFLFYIILLFSFWIQHLHHTSHKSGKKIWLGILIIISIVLWGMALYMSLTEASQQGWNYVWLVASVFIYACGYLALQKPSLFRKDIRLLKSPGEKYQRSALDEQSIERYKTKLLQYFEQEKPYLQQDLTLPALAKQSQISRHYLSQIINTQFNLNFFEFINRYRVEYAQKLLIDPEYNSRKLSEIGYLSGFNSISVFNSAFKKVCDQTPKEFREIQPE